MLKNTWLMLCANLLRLGANTLVLMLLARQWGASTFGEFIFPFTLAGLVALVVDYGFNLQLLSEIGRQPRRVRSIVASSLSAKLLLTGAVMLLAASYGHRIADDGGVMILWLLLAGAISNSYAIFFNLPLRALGKYDDEVKIVLFVNTVLVLTVAAFSLAGFGPLAIAIVFLGVRILYLVLSVLWYRRSVGGVLVGAVSIRESVAYLRKGFPFGVHVVVGALYFQVDSLIVKHYLGNSGIGSYQAAIYILLAGMLIADALATVYLPAMSSTITRRSESVTLLEMLNRQLFLFGLLGAIIMSVAGEWLARTIYGASYGDVVQILPLMGLVLFLRYAGAGYGLLLTALDRQTIRTWAVIAAFGVSLWMNFIFVPTYGLRGAVLASLITHALLNTVYVVVAYVQVRELCMNWRTWGLCGLAILHAMIVYSGLPAQLSLIAFCAALAMELTNGGFERLAGVVTRLNQALTP